MKLPFEFPRNDSLIIPKPTRENFVKINIEGHNVGYDICYDIFYS